MGHPTTIDYSSIKVELDNGLYEKYLSRELSAKILCEKLDISSYVLIKTFRKFGYKTKTEYRKSNIRNNFFTRIETEEQAYILGFYLADGSLSKKYNRISFSVTKADEEILNFIKDNIAPHEKIRYSKERVTSQGYTSKPMAHLSFISTEIAEDLNKYGIGNNKTYKTDIDISFIPENLMMHFIRGYFDGDGTVYAGVASKKVNGKQYRVENCNWSIISHCECHLVQIKEYLENKHGIKSNIIKDGRGNFLVMINRKEHFIKFRDILYENAHYYLKRKKDKYMSYSIEMKSMSKQVKVLYNDGWLKFESQNAAAKFLGVSDTTIANWLKTPDKSPYLIMFNKNTDS